MKHLASLREIIIESAQFVSRGSTASCEFDIPEGLWPVEVDTAQISQVFQNLVLNAVQAMPNGGTVTISAENFAAAGEQNLADGSYVRVCVCDTGVGIPEGHLERMYDPYFTTKQSGTGLGVTTARSIILRHGGAIDVERNKGGVTTCVVYVPAQAGAHVAAAGAEKTCAPTRGGRGHVLVMDDEQPVRTLIVRALQDAGYHVTAAATGVEALTQFRAAWEHAPRFDVVILDLTMRGGIVARMCYGTCAA